MRLKILRKRQKLLSSHSESLKSLNSIVKFSFIKFLLSKGTRNVEAAWKALKTGNGFFEMGKNYTLF